MDAYEGDPTITNALRLLLLTAARPGELRGARWDEIDTPNATWRIPAERMKMQSEHVVPLSRQASRASTRGAARQDRPAGDRKQRDIFSPRLRDVVWLDDCRCDAIAHHLRC
ncbi:MAG: hypothetical protein EXR39_06780 [Betaproteobacteria bacterium]|nr:hypothetical protein [Betaproteobacteria bacterium]